MLASFLGRSHSFLSLHVTLCGIWDVSCVFVNDYSVKVRDGDSGVWSLVVV